MAVPLKQILDETFGKESDKIPFVTESPIIPPARALEKIHINLMLLDRYAEAISAMMDSVKSMQDSQADLLAETHHYVSEFMRGYEKEEQDG